MIVPVPSRYSRRDHRAAWSQATPHLWLRRRNLRKGRAGNAFALLGTTEWPGFETPDLELADPDKMIAAYPALRREIEEFIRAR